MKRSFPEPRKMFLFQALSCKTYVKQMFYCLADPKSIHPILGSLCSDCSVISSPFNLIYSFFFCYLMYLLHMYSGQCMERSSKMYNSMTFAQGTGERMPNFMVNEEWNFDWKRGRRKSMIFFIFSMPYSFLFPYALCPFSFSR